jgi:hypothetical protein
MMKKTTKVAKLRKTNKEKKSTHANNKSGFYFGNILPSFLFCANYVKTKGI